MIRSEGAKPEPKGGEAAHAAEKQTERTPERPTQQTLTTPASQGGKK
jgi:hypothetical protein